MICLMCLIFPLTIPPIFPVFKLKTHLFYGKNARVSDSKKWKTAQIGARHVDPFVLRGRETADQYSKCGFVFRTSASSTASTRANASRTAIFTRIARGAISSASNPTASMPCSDAR